MEKQKIRIRYPIDIYRLLERWTKKRQENFLVVTLDGSQSVIRVHHISKGIVNKVIVHPRECFYPAIKDNACAVVFAHNHPSGAVKPSPEDDEIHELMLKAAAILGFHVLDSLIIAKNDSYYSYATSGKMQKEYSEDELKEYVEMLIKERG